MNEMEKLIECLKVLEIPHEVIPQSFFKDSLQVWYPSKKESIMDVICHDYSYGGSEGLLEIMGLLTPEEEQYDDVVGYLTAENVLSRIIKHREKGV